MLSEKEVFKAMKLKIVFQLRFATCEECRLARRNGSWPGRNGSWPGPARNVASPDPFLSQLFRLRFDLHR